MDYAEKSVDTLNRMLASRVLRRFPPIQADIRYLKADGEFSRGNKTEARKQLEHAQNFWLRDAARYQIELSGSRLIQGRIERGEGDFQKSADTFARGITERTQALGTVESDVGLMYIGRSLSLDRLGRIDEALHDANAAVATFERLGELHATYGLNALSTRGGFRAKAGDGDGAMQDLQLVVELRQRLFGPSNELANAKGVLAGLMISQKRPEEAVAILEAALQMAKEFSGENSRTAGSLRRRLAVAYRLAGRADDSLRVATELHASEETLHGIGSLESGEALMLRGQALHALGRHLESDDALKAAQQIFEAIGKSGEVRLGELTNWRTGVGKH
jgi:tetratricopeptide (TPR) repeat protein